MSQQNKVGKHATTIKTEGNLTSIKYHQTKVVEFSDSWILLNNGGYKTQTTKTRMNQASNQFNLGYRVYQKNYIWYVDYKNKTFQFEGDEMSLSRYYIREGK